MSLDRAHIALVTVNEAVLRDPAHPDAVLLERLGERVGRLTSIVATRSPLSSVRLSARAGAVAVPWNNRLAAMRGLAAAVRDAEAQLPLTLVQTQDPLFTGAPALWARRSGAFIATLCVFGTDPWDPAVLRASPAHRLAALPARALLARADAVQTDSTVLAERLRTKGLRVAYKRMRPEGLADFDAVGGTRRHRPAARSVLFVGRLARQKRLELMLEAFRIVAQRLPGARLTLVGDGPERARLLQRAARLDLGDAVEFRGAARRDELRTLYAESDLLALSSHYEGMPRVFYEAAASALPIVTTPVAGAVELNRDVPIGIADPAPAAFADALVELLEDADRRRVMGDALRQWVRRAVEFDPVEAQLEVWRELTAAGPR